MQRESSLCCAAMLASLFLAASAAHSEVLVETTGEGTLWLPAEQGPMAIAVLPACAPPGEPRMWAQRLADWGFGVLLFSGTSRARECGPRAFDEATLNGFRRASMELARRTGVGEPVLAALGWDTRLLIHAAASVFGGRDLFQAIVSLGVDVPSVGSALPIFRGDADDISAVRAFLERKRRAIRTAGEPPPAAGSWAEDPRTPGPDLPPSGSSLFDRLYRVDGRHRIPFPFENLIGDLNSRLGPPGSSQSVLHALIPRGRSLQRNAAPGEEDRFPRVVLGVDRFPDESDGRWRPLLRDRLFIAYQETEAVLEVVSFNVDAGRFEFQVVHDYRAAGDQRVVYPPRRLCMSCHQNGGPLFPEAPWDETADNPRVAARIRAARPHPYGLSVPVADNQALLLDTSTDRANLLPTQALLWREGCGADPDQRVRCRAVALSRMLQYRLSRQLGFDRQQSDYREEYVHAVMESWEMLWPLGLHFPGADIPNRDVSRDGLQIGPRLDPLRLRGPLETWTARDDALDGTIRGLAVQLPQPDLVQLDRFLRASAARRPEAARIWRAPCRVETRFVRAGIVSRVVDCGSDELELRGRLDSDTRDRPISGSIDTLVLGQGKRVGELIATGRGDGAGYDLAFWGSPYGVRPLPGHLVTGLTLAWTDEGAQVTLHTVHDFEPVSAAIAGLVGRSMSTNPLADSEFRPRKLLHSVFSMLGISFAPAPLSTTPVTTPRLETVSVSSEEPGHAPWIRHCVPCHAGPRPFPPPFLTGDSSTVTGRISRCAPRIARRLRMWHATPGRTEKTPMPPPAVVSPLGGDALAAELLAALSELAPASVFDPARSYLELEPCV